MATSNAPVTFGAAVIPTPKQHDDGALQPPPMLESPALTPASSRDDMNSEFREEQVPIQSPFYQHPPASFERSRQSSKVNIGAYEKDIEAGNASPLTDEDDNPFTRKISVDCNKECKMWPSKQTLIQEKMAEKKKRRDRKVCAGFGPVRDFWHKLDKRQQLLMKVAIALFLIGVAVAIGVGISIAVHGEYYSTNGSEKQVGGSSR